MRSDSPNGRITNLVSPNEHSSWLLLRTHVVGWLVLCALWISWQFWGDGSTLRRLLMAALALVSLVQALNAYGLMRRKRDHASRS
ncbi:hypothetical protein [Streptantibioticus silvisoli]|uniref:Uncharacterized protein n=1 Tax=Streptantibioticus silvisoli TaxID=2705255 RepID=A0ABT6W2X3_9ACTN|nr:hypothetical protein [Streptantibioticus silvisoli]MDI5965086.1 hypothetical protein [Streptantibioticus silvisoli]